ncbi:MAG: hypothetical protein EA401_02890 [Planctomycetota bacterium]|nr:MAG: hypothetical protein EA401_02890 [Planctomycetota bacterium]
MNHSPFDELHEAADHLRQAADGVARRMFGAEVQGELRQAGLHVVRAARHALQRAEDCFAHSHEDGRTDQHPEQDHAQASAQAASPPSTES